MQWKSESHLTLVKRFNFGNKMIDSFKTIFLLTFLDTDKNN